MKETLYQLDLAGNTKVWEIEVVPNGTAADIVVSSGRLHGARVKTVTTVSEGKNSGKTNQTNPLTQALAEAKSKLDSKVREGFVYNIGDAKSSATLGSGAPQPMLAQKHSADGSQKGSKTLAQIKILNKPVIVQPKLDGNRCSIIVKNGVPKMFTRKGDVMPVQLEHILNDVKSKLGGITDIILDGELFSPQFAFNFLNGLIKRITVTENDRIKRQQIKYHLYDIHSSAGYEKRMRFLDKFATENIIVIPSYEIIATDANIKKYLEQFLAEGHEGLMIRQLGMGYENKRTWQLCKVKVFEDAEFKLVGFDEDVRGGFVGAFVMQMKDGRTFNAGAAQGVDERTEMWYNKDRYLGKMATVCYFGLSEYGIPRFPKFKGVRDGK